MGNYFSFPSGPFYSCLMRNARDRRKIKTGPSPLSADAVPFGLAAGLAACPGRSSGILRKERQSGTEGTVTTGPGAWLRTA
jgi:hypothetical protein